MRCLVAYAVMLQFVAAATVEWGGESFACACNRQGKILFFNKAGEIVREHEPPKGPCLDFHVLANGNVLFGSGSHVFEMTPDNKVVFRFSASGNIVSCRRLPNGETLVYVGNEGRIMHVDAAGEIVREIKVECEGLDLGLGHARMLENGNYLVAHYTGKKACEYDATGKRVYCVPVPGGAFSAERLPNGNTLIAVTDKEKDPKLLEVDSGGKAVWEFSNRDIKEGDPLKFVAGFNRLSNGNILISNWLGHWIGKGKSDAPVAQVLEITRDKRIVRSFQHDALDYIVSVQSLNISARGTP